MIRICALSPPHGGALPKGEPLKNQNRNYSRKQEFTVVKKTNLKPSPAGEGGPLAVDEVLIKKFC